jgi:hypothetical protein
MVLAAPLETSIAMEVADDVNGFALDTAEEMMLWDLGPAVLDTYETSVNILNGPVTVASRSSATDRACDFEALTSDHELSAMLAFRSSATDRACDFEPLTCDHELNALVASLDGAQ